MKNSGFKRALSTLVVTCHLFLTLSIAAPAQAQDVDREAPAITFEPLKEGRAGDTQVFSASVSDDVVVDTVTLHYRYAAEGVYRAVPMEALAGTDIHTVSLEGIDRNVSIIQYYIEARDASGNRSVEGFAFDPLERALVEGAAPIAAASATEAQTIAPGMSTGRKVLYGVLGIIAVGALASLAGGSDDGGSGTGVRDDDPTDVRVTFVVDPLTP